MASKNAELVARDVIQTIRNGKKLNMGKIIKSRGYSQTVSEAPTKVTRTKTYQSVMKPVLSSLEGLRDKAIRELETRQLNLVEYKELIDSIDKLTKNIQLLGGNSTEKMTIVLPSEIVDKNSLK